MHAPPIFSTSFLKRALSLHLQPLDALPAPPSTFMRRPLLVCSSPNMHEILVSWNRLPWGAPHPRPTSPLQNSRVGFFLFLLLSSISESMLLTKLLKACLCGASARFSTSIFPDPGREVSSSQLSSIQLYLHGVCYSHRHPLILPGVCRSKVANCCQRCLE